MENNLDGKVEFLCPKWSQYQGLSFQTFSSVHTVVTCTPVCPLEASPVSQPDKVFAGEAPSIGMPISFENIQVTLGVFVKG